MKRNDAAQKQNFKPVEIPLSTINDPNTQSNNNYNSSVFYPNQPFGLQAPPEPPGSSGTIRRYNAANSLASAFFGSQSGTQSTRKAIPDGFEIKWTKSGLPYLSSSRLENQEWIAAAFEHAKSQVSMWCSKRELGDRFGIGIYLYFDFIHYTIMTNIVLLLLALINTIAHFAIDGMQLDTSRTGLVNLHRNFYISYYTLESRKYWLWTTAIGVGLSFLFGPIYANRVARYFRRQNKIDHQNQLPFDGEDIIEENKRVSRESRAIRMIFSYFLAIILLAISGGATFGIVILSENAIGNFRASLAIAVLIQAVNIFWRKICILLTKLERHRTWTSYRKNNTFKFYLFKMINVILMYVLRYLLRTRFNRQFRYNIPFLDQNNPVLDPCGINEVGDQFFALLIAELTIGNLWEVGWPWLLGTIRKRSGMTGKHGNSFVKPEFDVSEEYLELFYRQFVIYMGMTIFPLITFVGLIVNIVEYPLDKFRLLRIMREPSRSEGSMKSFVVFFLMTTSVIAAVSFPHGGLWVLLGFNFKDHCFPSVYNHAKVA